MANEGDITEIVLAEACFPHAVAGPVALAAAGEPASEWASSRLRLDS